MSVAGLKKQFHKASQLLNEKIHGAEGTKLDEEFLKMEKKIHITHKMLIELVPKTTDFLQPNPAYRARLGLLTKVSRIRGQAKVATYPQTEGILGDCMLRYARELGEGSGFGSALADIGEALKQMAQARDAMETSVKHNFIQPLQTIQDKDLRETEYHLKKLQGRRLDFDYKKRRKGKIPEEELKQAWEKFSDSKELAERSMFNLVENDVEQLTHVSSLVGATLDYHRQSCQILESLSSGLQARLAAASNRPKRVFRPKSIKTNNNHSQLNEFPHRSSINTAVSSDHQSTTTPESPIVCQDDGGLVLDQPCCRALYSFQPQNEGELGFQEGELILLTSKIDHNWYEGMIRGESGFLPVSYVSVLVPLPQ